MLHSLSIKNYALIEDIKIDFQKGFTIITGETGAGKSIMLGALGLLLGKRADYSVMRSAEEKCIIEGIFSIGSYNLESFFTREDLDYETQTIIRREILPSGKSRAFINDTPVTLPVLIELGDLLIDVHGQHQTLSLGENLYQFQVIDTLAKTGELLSAYKKELKNLKKLHQDLSELKENQAQAAREHDYNLFLMNELHEARLTAGMEEELENRYEELNNVETLSEHLGSAISVIQQEEVGSLVTLKEVRNNLSKIARFSNVYSALQERVESAIIELDDIAGEMENSLEKIEANPEELETVNARLQLIYNLQKKHSAENVEELLAILKELEEKVELTANAGVNLEKLQKEIVRKKEEINAIADKIHKARKSIIPDFTKEVETRIADLGMPNARLKIDLVKQEEFLATGKDKLSWQLSANKGGAFSDIKKAASGGELSRIMLAVKSILARESNLPTIIFDEIDTGVSGDIAKKMGNILQKMGASMQVIAITHLPQIAGKGSSHFKIFKKSQEDKTVTRITELQPEERVEELVLMLGGETGSKSAIEHAKSLLN